MAQCGQAIFFIQLTEGPLRSSACLSLLTASIDHFDIVSWHLQVKVN